MKLAVKPVSLDGVDTSEEARQNLACIFFGGGLLRRTVVHFAFCVCALVTLMRGKFNFYLFLIMPSRDFLFIFFFLFNSFHWFQNLEKLELPWYVAQRMFFVLLFF